MNKIFFIFIAAILVFWPVTKTYFLQDDWRFLSLVMNRPWWNIFIYYPQAIYRPVGQQLFFWIGSRLFGLNPVGFHLLSLSIHLINIYLLWRVIGNFSARFAESRRARFAATLWYAISPIHLISLNWLTQVDLELAVTFSLSAIILSFKTDLTKRLLGLVVYVFSLLSHEVALFLPAAILLISRRFSRTNITFYVFWLIIGVLILAIKYLINPFPLDEDYRVAWSFSQWLRQLGWYWWRSLGIIEGIRVYPFQVIIATGVLASVFIIKFRKTILPASIIYFLGVLPVMGLSSHSLAAYGTIGLALMTIWLGRNSLNNFLADWIYAPVVLIMAMVISWSALGSHWTTKRGEISRSVTEKLLTLTPSSQSIHVVSENNQINKEVYFATLEGVQLKVLFRDPKLEVSFEAFNPQPAAARQIIL